MALLFSLIMLSASAESPVNQLIVHAMCIQEENNVADTNAINIWPAPGEHNSAYDIPIIDEEMSHLWKLQLNRLKSKNRLINICPKNDGQTWQQGLTKDKQ